MLSLILLVCVESYCLPMEEFRLSSALVGGITNTDLFPGSCHLLWLRPSSWLQILCPSSGLPHLTDSISPSLGINASLAAWCCPMWQSMFPEYPEGILATIAPISRRPEVLLRRWFDLLVPGRHSNAPPCWSHPDTGISQSSRILRLF